MHNKYLEQIKEAFAPIPIFRAPLVNHEVVGHAELEKLGDLVFGDKDPSEIFYSGKIEEVQKVGDTYQLRIRLPFADTGDLSVIQAGNELIV